MYDYDTHSSGITLTNYLCNNEPYVKIPSSINNSHVVKIGDNCFSGHSEIKEIIVPSTVSEIGYAAFANCDYLENIELPDSIIKIGQCAFQDCKSLMHITLPPLVECLETGMFGFCYHVKEVILPTNLKHIEAHAFYRSGLRQLQLPESVITIEDGAFHGTACELITSLPIEDRWYNTWPFNETVRHSDWGSGIICDYKGDACGVWLEITVDFSDKKKCFFLPNDLVKITFEKADSQALAIKRYPLTKDSENSYKLWRRGLM